MDRMPTIMVKLEHAKNGVAPFLVRQMLKHDDTFIGTATRASYCGLLLEGLDLSSSREMDQARWTPKFLRGSVHQSVTPYIHGRYLYCCVYDVVQG
jgi:hypothetical protein